MPHWVGHDRHGFVPGARQGLAELGVRFEHVGTRDREVENLAGRHGRIKDRIGAGQVLDFSQHRIPGDKRRYLAAGPGTDHIRVGGIHEGDVALRKANGVEGPGEQVVRDGQLDEMDPLACDVGEVRVFSKDDGIIAIRVVAHDHCSRVDAAGRSD